MKAVIVFESEDKEDLFWVVSKAEELLEDIAVNHSVTMDTLMEDEG